MKTEDHWKQSLKYCLELLVICVVSLVKGMFKYVEADVQGVGLEIL